MRLPVFRRELRRLDIVGSTGPPEHGEDQIALRAGVVDVKRMDLVETERMSTS